MKKIIEVKSEAIFGGCEQCYFEKYCPDENGHEFPHCTASQEQVGRCCDEHIHYEEVEE